MDNTVEFFSGSGSFSNFMKEKGFNTFMIDYEKNYNPDLVKDIEFFEINELPYKNIKHMWFSIPCNAFSVCNCSSHFDINKNPKSDFAKKSLRLIDKCLNIIKESKPEYWYIENPRGLMRKFLPEKLKKNNIKFVQYTVWYCQYGDSVAKPTDIWTNVKGFQPKVCSNNKPGCNHIRAARGSKSGIQGLSNAFERSKIPYKLFEELIPFKEDKNKNLKVFF